MTLLELRREIVKEGGIAAWDAFGKSAGTSHKYLTKLAYNVTGEYWPSWRMAKRLIAADPRLTIDEILP